MPEKTESVPLVRTVRFYVGLVLTFVIVLIFNKMLPGVLPFKIFQFFFIKFSWEKLLQIPWFLLLVGPGLTLFSAFTSKNGRYKNIQVIENLKDELKTSILAGIFEEVSFRWLGFFSAIFGFWGIDQLTREIWASGWWMAINSNLWLSIPLIIGALLVINFIGLIANAILSDKSIDGCLINLVAGVITICVVVIDLAVALIVIWTWTKWSFDVLFIPAVNIITQGRLAEQLYGYGWAVTAAMVSVNWNFGKGHGYQGPIGVINSWIIGMIMFWVTFNFGFPVAVMVHIGYDILIDLIVAGDAISELAVAK